MSDRYKRLLRMRYAQEENRGLSIKSMQELEAVLALPHPAREHEFVKLAARNLSKKPKSQKRDRRTPKGGFKIPVRDAEAAAQKYLVH